MSIKTMETMGIVFMWMTMIAIDARGGLANDYRRAIKQNSIEGYIVFRDILERRGIKIK